MSDTFPLSLWAYVRGFFRVFSLLAHETSYRSIREVLDAEPGYEQDLLTQRWSDFKQKELYFVGITVRLNCLEGSAPNLMRKQAALIASLFGGAFSWYNIDESAWTSKCAWYLGLLFIIASISSATQQSITLFRFSSRSDACEMIRKVLGTRKGKDGRRLPQQLQVYIWQVPVMLLRLGIIMFLLGLTILLWDSSKRSSGDLKVRAAKQILALFLLFSLQG